MTTNDPRNPAPVNDSEAPPQQPENDHKVAENPPTEDPRLEDDDPYYQSEESGE